MTRSVARTLLTLALAGLALTALALTAPGAYAQQSDVARGTAVRTSGPETATYEIEASSGPIGESAAGLITRTFVGPGGNSTVVADVTCLAVDGNRAALIGRVRPEESVNVGYQAILIRIYDGTPALQPDAVATGVDPQFGSEITFTECAAFLRSVPDAADHGGRFRGGRRCSAAAASTAAHGAARRTTTSRAMDTTTTATTTTTAARTTTRTDSAVSRCS